MQVLALKGKEIAVKSPLLNYFKSTEVQKYANLFLNIKRLFCEFKKN